MDMTDINRTALHREAQEIARRVVKMQHTLRDLDDEIRARSRELRGIRSRTEQQYSLMLGLEKECVRLTNKRDRISQQIRRMEIENDGNDRLKAATEERFGI